MSHPLKPTTFKLKSAGRAPERQSLCSWQTYNEGPTVLPAAGWRWRCSGRPGPGRGCRTCSCSVPNTSWSTSPHTSGSRGRSNGQGNRQSPPRLGCKACKAVAPWVRLLEAHRDAKDETTEQITAPCLEILLCVDAEMLVKDCQPRRQRLAKVLTTRSSAKNFI